MREATCTVKDLNIVASSTSSPEDFDFLTGKWKIHNRKLKTRLNNCIDWVEFEADCECRKILKGFGNCDSFKTEFDGTPFEAITLRLFNPKTKLWSIYWADSNLVVLDVPQIGSLTETRADFTRGTYFTSRTSSFCLSGTRVIPTPRFGSRHFLPITERPGNGTGT